MTTVVLKMGGEVVAGPAGPVVAADLKALRDRDARVILVHGGGPQATELQKRLGIPLRQVGGRRITDEATLDVMKMVVAGRLNVDLCALLLRAGVRPVGLHGASSLVVRAEKRPPRVISGGGSEPVDFGLVGDVVGFDEDLLSRLLDGGYVPVIACLGADAEGRVYNINADIVANQLAAALRADRLFLVTSAPGVLRDVRDPKSRIPTLTAAQARQAVAEGVIQGGMIPKVEEALEILGGGVGAIHIVGHLEAGDLLKEWQEPGSVGTALIP